MAVLVVINTYLLAASTTSDAAAAAEAAAVDSSSSSVSCSLAAKRVRSSALSLQMLIESLGEEQDSGRLVCRSLYARKMASTSSMKVAGALRCDTDLILPRYSTWPMETSTTTRIKIYLQKIKVVVASKNCETDVAPSLATDEAMLDTLLALLD